MSSKYLNHFSDLPYYDLYNIKSYEEGDSIEFDIKECVIKKQSHFGFNFFCIGFIISSLLFSFIIGEEFGATKMKLRAMNEGVAGFINLPDGGKKFIFFKN